MSSACRSGREVSTHFSNMRSQSPEFSSQRGKRWPSAVLPNRAGRQSYNRFMAVIDLYIDDVVRLRKPHPCGGYEWRIVRLGADIGVKCLRCNHRVLIERPVLE